VCSQHLARNCVDDEPLAAADDSGTGLDIFWRYKKFAVSKQAVVDEFDIELEMLATAGVNATLSTVRSADSKFQFTELVGSLRPLSIGATYDDGSQRCAGAR
jgi:hypothetical protein